MPRVVGLGEILWDIMPDGQRHLGGAPMNVAVHAKALGCGSAVISAVGDDDLGREAIELLRNRHALDVSALEVQADRPTGAVDVRLQSGQPSYEFRSGVAWDFLGFTTAARQAIEAADAVVFGTLAQRHRVSRQAIHQLLSRTRADCWRVLDVNLRPPFYNDEIIRASLASATVLKLNDTELPVVLAANSMDHQDEWRTPFFERWPQLRMVALTRGEHGSVLYSRDARDGHALPAQQITVKDTVGAGDAFTAALITGLLAGRELAASHTHAAKAAAFVCSQSGATPRLPDTLIGAFTA